MSYKIEQRGNKYVIFDLSRGKDLKSFDEYEKAVDELTVLEILNDSLTSKSIDGNGDLTISEIDDTILVEGYLLRYTSPESPDLTNQWWSKKSYLMREAGFPIKGIPIKMAHSLEEEFSRIGIGIVNYVTEDELGIFIKGQLHKREKWKKIVQEASKRRGIKLTTKELNELADRAYKNMKLVVKQVPLQWSMGSYPPTFKVDEKTNHIDTAGIVEATLTPIPAEPNGTDVKVTIKQFADSLSFIESGTKENDDKSKANSKNLLNKQANFTKERNNMPMDEKTKREEMLKTITELSSKIADFISPAVKEEMADEEDVEVNIGEEEEKQMKSLLIDAIEKAVQKDTGFKSADSSEDIKKVVKSIVDDNMQDFVKSAVVGYFDEQNKNKEAIKNATKSVFDEMKNANQKEAPKSNQAGGYQKSMTPEEKARKNVQVTKNEEGSLVDFFKQVAMGIEPSTGEYTKSMKAQNPYVGTLGGFLVGQEMASGILDPLRPQVVMFNAGVTQTNVSGIGSYTVNKMTTVPSAYRPGINDQITESNAKFDSITAFLRPLAARVVIPRQLLLTTGTNVEQKIREEVIRSLRLHIDREILEGVGTVSGTGNTGAEIRGVKRVLSADPAYSNHIRTLATNGRKPKYDDLINAETQIAGQDVELDANSTSWVMHPRDRGTFRRTTDSTGQPLLYPSYAEKPYEDLIGYKVLTTTQIDNAQTTGTSNDTSDIYFGNWRYSEYVVGQDIEVIRDDMTLADSLNVRFIVYMYSDFIVHYPEAFYIMQGVRA